MAGLVQTHAKELGTFLSLKSDVDQTSVDMCKDIIIIIFTSKSIIINKKKLERGTSASSHNVTEPRFTRLP